GDRVARLEPEHAAASGEYSLADGTTRWDLRSGPDAGTLGPVLYDAARRSRGARHQSRAARERRRHARMGTAVSRDRERLLPEHQSQQRESDARLQEAGGPRHPRASRRDGGRIGRELPAGHDGQSWLGRSHADGPLPASRLLFYLRFRTDGPASSG